MTKNERGQSFGNITSVTSVSLVLRFESVRKHNQERTSNFVSLLNYSHGILNHTIQVSVLCPRVYYNIVTPKKVNNCIIMDKREYISVRLRSFPTSPLLELSSLKH